MKVRELIELLQKQNPEAEISLTIGDPNDTAYTQDVTGVSVPGVSVPGGGDDTVEIAGWVSSDDEGACAPWSLDRE